MADMQNDEKAQNDLNIQLKSAPWYQNWLRSQGQDPNRVKLNDAQRKQLTQIAQQNGVKLPQGVQFDPSGNANNLHGFAGQPGWLKALEIGGAATAGAAFGGPALLGALGSGGGAGAGAATAATGAGLTGPSAAGITAASLGGGGVVGPSAGGFSALSGLLGGKALGAAGTAISAASNSAAHNRGVTLDANLTGDQLAVNRQAEDRTERDDAFKRLQQADYLANRTQGYQAPTLHGQPLYDPGFGYKASTPTEVSGANGMRDELLKRLQGGSQLPVTDVNQFTKPSTAERIGGYAAPAFSVLGGLL